MVIKIGKKSKSWYLVLLTVIVLVLIFYSKTLAGFFQHDEWQTFAAAYLQNYGGVADIISDSFLPKASHYAPLFSLTFNLLFSFFWVNYLGYVGVSLVLHLLSVLLVFILAYRLTNKLVLSGISALLFGLNASSHQATSWIIANINTHGATIFGLLCLILFSYFLQEGRKRNLLFILSLVLLIVSLLFKEITIAFFAFLFLVLWKFDKATIRKRRFIYASIVLGLGILYFSLRFSMLSMPISDSEYVVTKDQSVRDIIYNTFTFPAKIFAQSVIPTWQLLGISKVVAAFLPDSIAGRPQTTEFDQFVENVALQVIDFSIFILAVGAVLFILKSRTERSLKKVVLVSFVFAVLNSFVYVLSPGRSGSIPVIDSRNIYLPTIGISVFIATVIYIIARGKAIRAVLMFVPLIFLHAYWLNQQLELRADIGEVRKNILHQIQGENPNLPPKVIFYIESDTAYYGLAEKLPPFETGLGQALLVWYNSTEKFPTNFFENRFLRFITDQGYKEFGGRGFGYFRDMSLLKETIKQNSVSLDSVISYKFYGGTNVLQETTSQTREELKRSK